MNRRFRRRRYTDRSFTRQSGEKAQHVINFFLFQREQPTRTNHGRMLGRQKVREAVLALRHANEVPNAA